MSTSLYLNYYFQPAVFLYIHNARYQNSSSPSSPTLLLRAAMKKVRLMARVAERTVSLRSSENRKFFPAVALISSSLLLPVIYLMGFHPSFSFLSFDQFGRLNFQKQLMHDGNGGDVHSEIIHWREAKTGEKEEIVENLNSNIETGGNASSNSTSYCDTSNERFDICFLQGDIRLISNASEVLIVRSSSTKFPNSSWEIRPYPRKWEAPLMERIRKFSISSSYFSNSEKTAPLCTVNHTTPAIVFSTGGFSGNFYHDVIDILIPLYVTSHHFQSEVKFLLSEFSPKFITKYQPFLARLSRHELINLDRDNDVHCFPEVHVGLVKNKEFGIDTTKPPPGPSMNGFRDLLRSSFSLKRKRISTKGRRKPKLMIQLRKGSRELVNSREVISMSRKLGFKVVVAGLEETKNITSYSTAVNSVDALLGVHGAGLTNMVFLPEGASLIQIIPWGGLKWACRFSYGDPAMGMGLKYFEYEIKEEESTLIEQYPRNHLVFTNPAEIHKQGWNMLWYVFLEKQKVRVDVKRLRTVLVEVLRYLKGGE